jgi:glucokinase
MQKNKLSEKSPTIGIDVGGTKISAGWVENNRLVKSHTQPTPARENKEVLLAAIADAVRALHVDRFDGIGIGIPGLVDTHSGVVYDVQNIPSLSGAPLKADMEKIFRTRVEINNDANCFVLGVKNDERLPFENIVGLTLGTGLGGGLILNGQLYEGVGTGAGEFGFLPYKESTLEDYCSGRFFQREYGIPGKEAALRSQNNDPEARQMFVEFGKHLGRAIRMIAHALAPEAVALGGSVSQSFPLFEKSMRDEIHRFPYGHVVEQLKVVPALSRDIALVGAASLIRK